MRFRKQRGPAFSLALACHPVPTRRHDGRGHAPPPPCPAAAAPSASWWPPPCSTGQLTIGWINDVVDRERDRRVGRLDKPVARGWVEPGTVTFAVAVAVLLVIPLSLANGTAAGLAHLAAVLAAWLYDLYLKQTVLSWLPFAVGFGLIPAFLSYGGLGGGLHGGPPTLTMTALAALLGVGLHFLAALPDLVEDNETGVRHLPLRVALRTGAPRLLWISTAYTALVAVGLADRGPDRRPASVSTRLCDVVQP